MFNEESIILREVCNGIMCVSALVLIAMFLDFIWKESRSKNWYNDPVVQSAIVIVILLGGHALRALSGWMQFLWLDIGWDPTFWANSIELFIVATVLIVVAKQLMVLVFSPVRHRGSWSLIALSLSVGIPIIVALIVAGYNKSQDGTRLMVVDAELVAAPDQGRMTLRYRAINSSVCPVIVDVAIATRDTDTVVWRHRGDAVRVSADWLAEVSVPRLRPGPYLYHTTFRAKCSETRIYVSDAPPVPFEIN